MSVWTGPAVIPTAWHDLGYRCVALMINARRVAAIGDTWIRYGNQTFRRDRPGRPVGVPVWNVRR
ncbi:MAG: hypothetical protein EOP64_02000 [Sphingomonas sp.]|nr:MAG: hypothetical protein EOP64_02000 [Sphingomonas sp.]